MRSIVLGLLLLHGVPASAGMIPYGANRVGGADAIDAALFRDPADSFPLHTDGGEIDAPGAHRRLQMGRDPILLDGFLVGGTSSPVAAPVPSHVESPVPRPTEDAASVLVCQSYADCVLTDIGFDEGSDALASPSGPITEGVDDDVLHLHDRYFENPELHVPFYIGWLPARDAVYSASVRNTDLTAKPVPEPASLALAAVGLGAGAALRRRRGGA